MRNVVLALAIIVLAVPAFGRGGGSMGGRSGFSSSSSGSGRSSFGSSSSSGRSGGSSWGSSRSSTGSSSYGSSSGTKSGWFSSRSSSGSSSLGSGSTSRRSSWGWSSTPHRYESGRPVYRNTVTREHHVTYVDNYNSGSSSSFINGMIIGHMLSPSGRTVNVYSNGTGGQYYDDYDDGDDEDSSVAGTVFLVFLGIVILCVAGYVLFRPKPRYY